MIGLISKLLNISTLTNLNDLFTLGNLPSKISSTDNNNSFVDLIIFVSSL